MTSVRCPNLRLPRWLGSSVLAVLPFLCSGCVIPVYRSTVLLPTGTVIVRDTESHAPIDHARVFVRRYNVGPPPRRQSHQYIGITAADGRTSFTLVKGHEWAMPLMMHGVTQWAFDVCVDAPGYQGRPAAWLVQGMWTEDKDRAPQPDLVVALPRGEGSCEASPEWQSFTTKPATETPSPP